MTSGPAQLLRDHGLQVTAQRLAVLRAVAGRPHSTADAIAEDVRAEIGAISRQTVYDVLSMLVEKSLIRRIQPGRAPALYEDKVDDDHHHLICRDCGKAVDVDFLDAGKTRLVANDDRGFKIDDVEVIFWGTCPECLA